MGRSRWRIALGLATCLATGGCASTVDVSTQSAAADRRQGHCRAGCPLCVSSHAVPTYTPDYAAGYVGGGVPFGGEPRRANEGTWGRDYVGSQFARRVWLRWTHGARDQGGAGAYATDGPKLIE